MSLKDELIVQYFTLATNLPLTEIATLETRLSSENPMLLKKELAYRIVSELHSKSAAQSAESSFTSVHQQGEIPADIPTITPKSRNIVDIIVDSNLAASKSEARRLINQGGVEFNENQITSIDYQVSTSGTLKIGKRKFAKLLIEN